MDNLPSRKENTKTKQSSFDANSGSLRIDMALDTLTGRKTARSDGDTSYIGRRHSDCTPTNPEEHMFYLFYVPCSPQKGCAVPMPRTTSKTVRWVEDDGIGQKTFLSDTLTASLVGHASPKSIAYEAFYIRILADWLSGSRDDVENAARLLRSSR